MAIPPIHIEGIRLRLSTPTILGLAVIAAVLIYAIVKL